MDTQNNLKRTGWIKIKDLNEPDRYKLRIQEDFRGNEWIQYNSLYLY